MTLCVKEFSNILQMKILDFNLFPSVRKIPVTSSIDFDDPVLQRAGHWCDLIVKTERLVRSETGKYLMKF